MPGDGILVQTFPQFAGSVGLAQMVPGDLHPLKKRRRQVGQRRFRYEPPGCAHRRSSSVAQGNL
jgi:hypothetical protein